LPVLAKGTVVANKRTGAMLEVTEWPEIGKSGAVQIRRVLRPGMGFRIPHVHLFMDETYHVEYGVADFRIGPRSGRLSQSQSFRVPRFEVHLGPLNRSTGDLVFLHTFEAARTGPIKRYVETLARFLEEGRDLHGDLPPLVAAAVFAGKDQQTFLPGLSLGLQQKVVFPMARSIEEWRTERRRARSEAKELRAGNSWDDW
jgi:mannose-6-phosphate isomerase-like protein (cupin superfamily)